ncbi:MAG: dTDP-4-dehydrorhamnose reductase [Candidatus Aureabacteria bacterium]|nr:dTDP-4-dehydrorhamnose reductase [Candidatus Auribacterota bacterium]
MNKNKKIAIIGANGQLGSDLKRAFSEKPVLALNGPPEHDIDITDIDSIRRALDGHEIDFIINTAAYTDVPNCENLKDLAYSVNALGAKNVAVVSREIGAYLVHLSSDYVFDGTKTTPYLEEDNTDPLNYYGYTKLEGEMMIVKETQDFYIVRTSGLYGVSGCLVKGENFVDKMLHFAKEKDIIRVVDNEVLTPTYSLNLAMQIKKMTEILPIAGIYHATSGGECSWYEFTKEIFKLSGMQVNIVPAHQSDFESKVKRPLYSVLENAALKKADIDIMKDWRIVLKEYLKEKNLL